MKLFINDSPIDITPSENDTIQTMLNAILKELEEGLIIASMEIDGEFASIDDPQILEKSINTIEKVELIVATNIEIGLSLLIDGKQFIDYSIIELQNGSIIKKNQMIESFRWIIESMEALRMSLAFPPTDIAIIKAIVDHIIKQLDEDDISLETMSSLVKELQQVSQHMEILQEKLQNPDEYSKESTFNKVRETQLLLCELATNFQTGSDLQAIQQLCSVIDTIEMYTRYAASNPQDSVIEAHAIDLKDLSSQLLLAFENKDFILIADLIEYDLNDKFDEILEDN